MKEEATLTTTLVQFQEMLDVTTVGYHDEVYLNIDNGRTRLLAGSPGSSAGTYTDFVEAYFEGVDGTTEAYFDSGEVMSYIDLVADGPSSKLELRFLGTESDRLANKLVITPARDSEDFEVSLMLSSGSSVIESIPGNLPQSFDQNNRFIGTPDGEPLSTKIDTTISQLNKIDNAISLREELEYKPIVVQDGQFRLDVGDESSQKINARLEGKVEGPDVSNVYGGHFKDIVRELEGQVTLFVDEAGPMQVLQEKNHMVIRHMLGSAK